MILFLLDSGGQLHELRFDREALKGTRAWIPARIHLQLRENFLSQPQSTIRTTALQDIRTSVLRGLSGQFCGHNSRHYGEIIPMVRNHVWTSPGHLVMGYFVGRNPKACLPSAYRCISTGTPAFSRAV